ncbi:MAG: TetR/AcrR family transcriptional regulator [Ketobacter sp.]|nr:MAG: TetR/AcrR family transcriptional regulator [Ketobacter sp.]
MQPRKQHLINTAYRLFNEHGYHATGIDRILAESGVSKATLYKHFRSKDELVVAVLQQRHEQLIDSVGQSLEHARASNQSTALVIFDVMNEWFRSDQFFGCNFINASAEYASKGNAVYTLAAEHKAAIQSLIQQGLDGVSGKRKRILMAEQLALLVDGAIVRAHTRGDRDAALLAKKIATQVLGSQ